MNDNLVSSLIALCPVALAMAVPSAVFAAKSRLSVFGAKVRNLRKLRRIPATTLVVFASGVLPSDRQVLFTRYIDEPDSMSVAYTLASSSRQDRLKQLGELLASQESAQLMPVTQMGSWGSGGMHGRYDDARFLLGDAKDLKNEGVEIPPDASAKMEADPSAVGFARNRRFLGYFLQRRFFRPQVVSTIGFFRETGVRTLVFDNAGNSPGFSDLTGVDEQVAGLSLQDRTDTLLERRQRGDVVLAVGGAQDESFLAAATVSVILKQEDAEIAGDVVISGSDLSHVADVYKVACTTLRIARQNLIFSVVYTVITLLLGAGGFIDPGQMIFLLFVSVLVVNANALRIRYLSL